MKCLSPIQIKNPNVSPLSPEHYISVPCGHCSACCNNLGQDWSIRLFEEQKRWGYWSFVTLTYSSESICDKYVCSVDYLGHSIDLFTLDKVDFKAYIKKLRNRSNQFKYFLCGEYGSKTLRCHGHAIFFYNDQSFVKEIESCWTHGFVHFSRDANTGSKSCVKSLNLSTAIQYVTKYSCKRSSHPFFYDSNGSWMKEIAQRPFRLMSKNLGSNYFDSSRLQRLKSLDPSVYQDISELVSYPKPTRSGTVPVPLPRYYKDKLFKIRSYEKLPSPIPDAPEETRSHTSSTPLGILYKTNLLVQSDRKLASLLKDGIPLSDAVLVARGEDVGSISLRKEKLQKVDVDYHFSKSKF